ncbi:MAG: hypothetical protein ACI9LM_002397 [Alteromonadaceae bacterium]|jgi:hypothetical protein
MTAITSISELLSLSNSQYRIYDISRKIDKISKKTFSQIELNQIAYPSPSQKHAFIAIAFWQKENTQPYLWFVKLPLDEQGLLNQGSRNHFIAIIVEALGSDLTINPNERQEELLKNNPYHFTPSQYKFASLNSILSHELKKDMSAHLAYCKKYFSAQSSWANWQNIGVQGLADFAVLLCEDKNSEHLTKALPHLPEQVLIPLCSALENHKLSFNVIEAITNRIEMDKSSNLNNTLHLIRSLASSTEHPHVINIIDKLMSESHVSIELLIVIAGKCWHILAEQCRMTRYLELLIVNSEQQLFNGIFADLVAIPSIRPILFQAIRSENRSVKLTQAIGLLFQAPK